MMLAACVCGSISRAQNIAWVGPTVITGDANLLTNGTYFDAFIPLAPASLTARVAAEATSPLQPISEPVARAMAEDALNTEAHSPNASVRSTALLVQGLAGIVLGSTDPNGAPTS